AQELKRNSAVSPVVETIRGFVILKLLDRVTEENKEQLAREFITYRMAADEMAAERARKFAQDLIKKVQAGEALEEATATLIDEALEGTEFSAEDSVARKAESAPKTEISRSVSIEQSPI